MEILLSSNLCIGCFIWNVDILVNMKFIITYTKILIDIATKQILFGSLVNAKERTNRSAKNIVKYTQRLILTYIPKTKGKKNKACWKIVGNWTCLGWKEVIQKVTSVFLSCCSCCWVAQLCWSLCDPMDGSMPGFLVLYYFPELAQTHVHQVSDAVQASHPLRLPSPPAFNLSQHLCLF